MFAKHLIIVIFSLLIFRFVCSQVLCDAYLFLDVDQSRCGSSGGGGRVALWSPWWRGVVRGVVFLLWSAVVCFWVFCLFASLWRAHAITGPSA